jgi:6-pyruvoyltetrahydropterin/6-carboxytetrahydropterin synthase
MAYSLVLAKENFKFSASHFTLFSENDAEHLHGHNYFVAVKAGFGEVDGKTEMAVDFNTIKKEIKTVCEKLDEKILIAGESPFLRIEKSPHYADHTEVRFKNRVYCFPTGEIRFLPLANITSEALARHIHGELTSRLPRNIQRLAVAVRETPGQTATYFE